MPLDRYLEDAPKEVEGAGLAPELFIIIYFYFYHSFPPLAF